MSIKKTNAARLLDKLGVSYELVSYVVDEDDLSATHVANALGVAPEVVFKTLVARDDAGRIVVTCIAGPDEIDLKSLAREAKAKRCELIAVKEILGLTGYIRGGCSPLAMKKNYPTFVDSAILEHEHIYVSAGVRGVQLKLSPDSLITSTKALCVKITS